MTAYFCTIPRVPRAPKQVSFWQAEGRGEITSSATPNPVNRLGLEPSPRRIHLWTNIIADLQKPALRRPIYLWSAFCSIWIKVAL